MVKIGILGICLLFAIVNNYGQISEPGLPESFLIRTKSAKILPVTKLDSLDTGNLEKSDIAKGIKNRYGIVKQINTDIKQVGVRTTIAGKGTIWQYAIQSPNSKALGINFSLFLIPPDAKLFIYDETHTQILGAFTYKNNNPNAFLAIADLNSNNAIIEYFEPLDPQFEGELVIGSIAQAYRKISYSTQAESVARIGINCEQGTNWQDQKHAVCFMTFNASGYTYYCSGFLVNNTAADGTPYFMTANHCISSEEEAQTLVTYFNYENSSCSSSNASLGQSISGSILKANNIYSDFSLLLLNDVPPLSYMAYYAGWDASGSISASSAGIHHPNGTPKCVSIDNGSASSFPHRISWDDGYVSSPYTHWKVTFDEGETEGGSSGSPLFDDKKRVIGQLHGGGDKDEFYGKFNVSWDYSTKAASQLKIWLDPINSGTTILDGTFYKVKPKSEFISDLKQICVTDAVTFTDKSYYAPNEWNWIISPAGYEFIAGTDSLSQNPQIKFNKTGLYSVSLITKNNFGSDTLIKTNHITTVSEI